MSCKFDFKKFNMHIMKRDFVKEDIHLRRWTITIKERKIGVLFASCRFNYKSLVSWYETKTPAYNAKLTLSTFMHVGHTMHTPSYIPMQLQLEV